MTSPLRHALPRPPPSPPPHSFPPPLPSPSSPPHSSSRCHLSQRRTSYDRSRSAPAPKASGPHPAPRCSRAGQDRASEPSPLPRRSQHSPRGGRAAEPPLSPMRSPVRPQIATPPRNPPPPPCSAVPLPSDPPSAPPSNLPPPPRLHVGPARRLVVAHPAYSPPLLTHLTACGTPSPGGRAHTSR